MIRNIVHRLRKYENGFFRIELKIVLNKFNNNEKKGMLLYSVEQISK